MPQISEVDKAYAAGFFDGEGSVIIEKPRQRRGYTLLVSIAQKESEVLKWFSERWGGAVKPWPAKNAYRWKLSSAMAGVFLSDIMPYLRVKREVARLALELQATKSHATRNNDEYLSFCKSIREAIQRINAET